MLTSYVSSVGYNLAGQVMGLTLGSGVVESYEYSNDRLQLKRQKAEKGAATLMDLNYSYAAAAGASGVGTTAGNSGQLMAIGNNPVGQPSKINEQSRNQAFTYDDLGRLVTATGWGVWERRYAYDRWGNRTGVWDATSGGNQIQSVGLQLQGGAPTNRMTSVTTGGVPATQSYDAVGNLTSDGAHTYQYDGEGRLAKMDAGIGNEANYYYDSANRRVKKVWGGHTTYYVWEAAQVIAEYSNAPAGVGGTSYYLADRLSNRMTTDDNGGFKGTQDHLPFGDEGGTTGIPEKHRFTTYERDGESGTDYAINRQYGLGVGRFTRPDPVEGIAEFPQTLNRYSYTVNDPVDLVDPLGLSFGAQDMGTCPAQFASCMDVVIPGLGRVMVGLDGLGGGTFLWGNSTLTDGQLTRFNELFGRLPKAFQLAPLSLEELRDPFLNGVRDQIYSQFRLELARCDEVAGKTFTAYMEKNKLDITFLKNRGKAGEVTGTLGGMTSLFATIGTAMSTGALASPVGIGLSFLAINGLQPGKGDWRADLSELERGILNDATKVGLKSQKQCRKAVKRKFGFK